MASGLNTKARSGRAAWVVRHLLPLLLVLGSASVRAQFNYTTNNGTITITGYTGPGDAVDIPDTINGLPVRRIGESAFGGNNSLTSVTIPSGVTNIGYAAFSFCLSLTSVTIPNSVTGIGDYAFINCTSLAEVTIPNSVTRIGDYAFLWCGGLMAFTVDAENPAYSSMDGVLFDKNRTKLIQCPALKTGNYTVPSGVTSILNRAFLGCINLVKVTIPGSVTSIGFEAFLGCSSLTAISVDGDNPAYSSLDGVLFNKGRTTLIQWPRGRTEDYIIPHGVIRVEDSAFYGCSLTSVTIPSSVTFIGPSAFYGCFSLERVHFQGNIPRVGDNAFFLADKATVYYLPGTTGWRPSLGGRPTKLWSLPHPVILRSAPGFGPTADGFSFSISWATNAAVVVEASSDLAAPNWIPMSTNTLTAGTSRFTDPQWTNHPARLYRVVSP